jgi:NAD(P)-dependent dehydrogenase (short-subunit alcohol dehydrogenase family)
MSSESNTRIAVVTGAAMGIGAAIAEQLARDGMTVLVSDVNLQEAEKTAQGFRDAGMSAAALQLDVGAAGSIDAAFASVAVQRTTTRATGAAIIPVSCSRDVGGHFGTKDYTEVAVPGGHIGTFVGRKAQKILAPTLAGWFEKRS